jgi:hypothetical protein
MSTTQSFHGRKLLQQIPCRPAFDGSGARHFFTGLVQHGDGLGAGVTACEPSAAHIDPEKMTTRPTRSFGAVQINATHDLFLEAIFPRTDAALHQELREGLLERTQPEQYPNNSERQDIAFTPSQISFNGTHFPAGHTVLVESGPYTGKYFTHSRSPRHWLLVVDRASNQKRRAQSKALDNQADTIAKLLPTVSDGKLRCVGCSERDIDADGFVLCFWCNAQRIQNFLVDRERLGFGLETQRASLRKDSGFQDDSEAEKAFHYPLLDAPVTAEKVTEIRVQARKTALKKNFSKEEEQQLAASMIRRAARPLEETELAWILSEKCKGWTVRNSQAWKKAQRVAAQLAGHYIFGKTCGQIAQVIGKEEEALRKICVRHRAEYFNKLLRGPMPEEARVALASGVLRELYPPAVTSGQFGWGEFDAKISAVFPEPEKILMPSIC